MAVVKANYVKRGIGDRGRAKRTVRYITHRRDRDGEKITRQLFGFDGALTKEQVYRMIDEAQKGTIFYRFIISPNPSKEDRFKDLSLTDITIDTMIKLEERIGRQIQFAAAIHADHTQIRHIHVLALVKGRRLTREDFQTLRQEATENALFQRQMLDRARPYQEQEVKRIRRQARGHSFSSAPKTQGPTPSSAGHRLPNREYSEPPKLFASYSCPICPYHETLVSTNRLSLEPHRCPYCGVKLRLDRESALSQNLRRGKEGGLSLSLAP
jgi:hypothetical protein